jgi:hypothetical protein
MLLSSHIKFKNGLDDPTLWTWNCMEKFALMAPIHKNLVQAMVPSFASDRKGLPILTGLGCSPMSISLWLPLYDSLTREYPKLVLPWLEEADESPGSHFL